MKTRGFLGINIVGIVAWLLVFSSTGFAEWPFGKPQANYTGSNEVSVALATKIALWVATDNGKRTAALGTPIECVDDDGDIVAYMFPLVMGKQTFPSYSEIFSDIQYGRKVYASGFDAMNTKDQQAVVNAMAVANKENSQDYVTISNGDAALLPPPDYYPDNDNDIANNKARLNNLARKKGSKLMIGAVNYGTIVVSARYDRYPIPYYSNYLPPYLFQGDLAVAHAKSELKSDTVILQRVYFLENTNEQYFEFSSSKGQVLLNSHDLRVEQSNKALMYRGTKAKPVMDIQSDIDKEWNNLKDRINTAN